MLFLMGVLALLLTTPNANADDKEKYKLFAEETRKEVWALKLPEFTNTAVPDKYKDESAVILAAHSRLEITKKTRFNVGAFLGGFHYYCFLRMICSWDASAHFRKCVFQVAISLRGIRFSVISITFRKMILFLSVL